MSLPSIPAVAQRLGIDLSTATEAQCEEVLVESMRIDLPLAVKLIHDKGHGAGADAEWLEDPNSDLGKQVIRILASDALRPLAEKHFICGNKNKPEEERKKLWMVNCCKGGVGKKPENLLRLQVETQAGPIAYADC